MFIWVCFACGAQGPPQNGLSGLFCSAPLLYSGGNTIMSRLHVVSEADKQNNLCFVCVLLMVLGAPHGAAALGPSRRTDQRRCQALSRLSPPTSTDTHTHSTTQGVAQTDGTDQAPSTQRTAGKAVQGVAEKREGKGHSLRRLTCTRHIRNPRTTL